MIRTAAREVATWSPLALLVVFSVGVIFSLTLHAQDTFNEEESRVKLAVMDSRLKDLSDLGPQVNAIKMHAQESDAMIRQLKDEMDAVFSVAKWIAFGVFGLIGMQAWKKLYPTAEDGGSLFSLRDRN